MPHELYLLGTRDLARDQKFYLDIFCREVKRGRVVFDGHLVFRLDDRLTHEMLWAVFSRLLRTFNFDLEDMHSRVLKLRKFDLEKISKERNRLMYKPFSWSREENIVESDLENPVTYLANAHYLFGSSDAAEYVPEYFFLPFAIHDLLNPMLDDIGVYAPTIAAHASKRTTHRRVLSDA